MFVGLFFIPATYITITNNGSLSLSLCVCVYEIFTLTFAFVSRWYYFSVFFPFLVFYILHRAHFFFCHLISLLSKFSCLFVHRCWPILFFCLSPVTILVKCCFVLGYSCFMQWWVLHFVENWRKHRIQKKHTKNEIGKEEKSVASMWIENLCQKKEDTNTRMKHFFSSWLCVFFSSLACLSL